MVAESILKQAQDKMSKAVTSTKEDFSTYRTGRASPHLLDKIEIDYYGTKTPLNQIAGISVPEGRLLVVTPYDKNTLGAIDKAITASDLGINPTNDGTVIRLAIPPLTEERRKDMIKSVHHRAEEGRVAIRNVRRHSKEEMEKMKKDGEMSEDELMRVEKELQKLTDQFVAQVDDLSEQKEKELLEV
ncbi:MAG TPA: ribosome recycling factor [Actinomycetota bacterium]|nr:ribosome recycling factor [Actinomycetota bacterium]